MNLAIIAIIVVGIVGAGVGIYLRLARAGKPAPVKPASKRRPFLRRTCRGCGESYAMNADEKLMHHKEGQCVADHVGITPGAGFVPSEEVDS